MTDLALTDELLSAYADGELPEDIQAQVRAALENDAGARVRLEKLRHADALLRQAFPLSTDSQHDALAAHILAAPATAPTRAARTRWMALAASIGGLAVGLSINMIWQNNTPALISGMDRNTANHLVTALDRIRSGAVAQHADGDVRMIMSFNATQQRVCRVFGIATPHDTAEGIACRSDEGTGKWEMMAWHRTPHAKGDGYVPAGGSELIDTAMQSLGGSQAMEPAAEQTLINQQWRR